MEHERTSLYTLGRNCEALSPSPRGMACTVYYTKTPNAFEFGSELWGGEGRERERGERGEKGSAVAVDHFWVLKHDKSSYRHSGTCPLGKLLY